MNKETELLLVLNRSGEAAAAAQASDGVYPGADLTAKFASEVGSDAWAWIRSRIQAANYSGIHVGDYIPFTAGGNTYHAQVAGIDTYYLYGSPSVGHHIDFITRQLFAEGHAFNATATNNGTSDAPSPWMASGIRNWLNETVFDALPEELQAVIVGKTFWAEKRYSSAGALTSSAGAGWYDLGNLWLPTEVEVFGYPMVGTPYVSAQGSMGQYPIFSGTSARGKSKVGAGRDNWWLMTAADGGSSHFVAISNYGCGTALSAASAAFVPICFRIA